MADETKNYDSSYIGLIDKAFAFVNNALSGKTDTAEEMLKNWNGDYDGGLAEFVRWTINDGDYPKEETLAVLSYLQKHKLSSVLNKQTRYGDTLTITHIVNKLQRNGFTEQAKSFTSNLSIQDIQGGNISASELGNTLDFGNQKPPSVLDQLANILGNQSQNYTGNTGIGGNIPQIIQTNNLFSLKNLAIGFFLFWIVKKIFK